LQKSASIQPRTSPSKFGGKFNSLFTSLLNPDGISCVSLCIPPGTTKQDSNCRVRRWILPDWRPSLAVSEGIGARLYGPRRAADENGASHHSRALLRARAAEIARRARKNLRRRRAPTPPPGSEKKKNLRCGSPLGLPQQNNRNVKGKEEVCILHRGKTGRSRARNAGTEHRAGARPRRRRAGSEPLSNARSECPAVRRRGTSQARRSRTSRSRQLSPPRGSRRYLHLVRARPGW